MLVFFMVIWYILWLFDNVVVIGYIFPRFGILCQEKSGNPEPPTYPRANFNPASSEPNASAVVG
jgi:hypothetical protein